MFAFVLAQANMTKKRIITWLIGVGVTAVFASGLAGFLVGDKDKMSWGEYVALMDAYNAKIQDIKDSCETDARCVRDEAGNPKAQFLNVKKGKDMRDTLDKLLRESNSKYIK